MRDITLIGKTDWRNQNIPFGIKEQDRVAHIYVIGKTGVGKSTLLLNMAISDIKRGNGIAVIDPHGDLAAAMLDYIPKERINDVIYFNPSDTQFPVPFNPLVGIAQEQHFLAAAGLIATFKRIWPDSWGPRLEHILRFTLLTLLEYGNSTLLDIQQLLTNQDFRNDILSTITNVHLISFWRNEFDKYSPQLKAEAIAPILNKVGIFQASPVLQNIVGRRTMTWSMQELINERKILIANLSKGLLGEDVSSLLGSTLINGIFLSALGRANLPEGARVPFYLYIDEAHSFLTKAIVDILTEARKFKLSLFLAHQYIDQLDEDIRSAVFGNVGTLISFRVGAEDALVLAKEFCPVFKESDLINLPKYSIYLKLMIDGVTSKPFSAVTLPLPCRIGSFRTEILEQSKLNYAKNHVLDKANPMTDTTRPPSLF